jgi:hypothetical protein
MIAATATKAQKERFIIGTPHEIHLSLNRAQKRQGCCAGIAFLPADAVLAVDSPH